VSTVKTKAEECCSEISIRLNEHLNSKETKGRIFLWSIPELPNGDDMEVIEYKAKEMIIKRINQDIREWCNKENVNNITQELSDLFNRECKLPLIYRSYPCCICPKPYHSNPSYTSAC
jgi:hypothetical protein